MTPSMPVKLGVRAVLVVTGASCAAFFIGFYWLPSASGPATLWQRMCRAAGFVAPVARDDDRLAAAAAYTTVVTPREALLKGTPDQIGLGATLALRCTGCHGAQGLSGANSPNLAGQHSEVIYKELVDFKRGARTDAVMDAMVATLTDANMLDLAHYYSDLPSAESDRGLSGAPALVRVGDPMRSIAPCASCHGRSSRKIGAPMLDGEPLRYLVDQLSAFANGARRNDANAVMRGEVRRMTAAEINLVAEHYASH
jgi:cytochrome c553